MSNFEKKFGKYAIPNLTLILIMCYIVGYAISLINSTFLSYLTLDPGQILFQGQIWRLFTWLIVPPDSPGLFTIIMLFFYYNIGTLMERTLGTYRYNVYLILGMLLTVAASFLCFGLICLFPGMVSGMPVLASFMYSPCFSTYYINISIFLAFAVCYPEMQVLLMFVIPVKVKWMGILDLVLLGYDMIAGNIFTKFAVGAALLNFLLFYLRMKNMSHLRPKEMKRRAEFKQQVRRNTGVTKHKCAICGQTDEDNPNIEFRFCSKCNGNYEYCQEHLFTHEHVR
ncbi:MAG: hypothetical protein NC081_08095 [Roseburia sp.]|nr:hypothetical protein [Roseburia sp.]